MPKLTESTTVTTNAGVVIRVVVVTSIAVASWTTIWLDVQTLKASDEVKSKKLERISEQITDLRDDIRRVSGIDHTAFKSRPVLANP